MPKTDFATAWSEQRTVDEKLDFLAKALELSGGDKVAQDLKDWSDNQKGVYVDPAVAKAQEQLEKAEEKASS